MTWKDGRNIENQSILSWLRAPRVYHIRLWANFKWNRCPTKLGWCAKWQKFLKCCRCYHFHNHLRLALRCFVWLNSSSWHCCERSWLNSLQNKPIFPFERSRNGGILGVFSPRKREAVEDAIFRSIMDSKPRWRYTLPLTSKVISATLQKFLPCGISA